MKIEVVRFAYLPECTLNFWFLADQRFAGICEPWIPNPFGPGGARADLGQAESCIPEGDYIMRPHVSREHPDDEYVWSISNPELAVYAPGKRPAGQKWGRDAVLAHTGNTLKDTLGCELVGMSHSTMNGEHAVVRSRAAIGAMRKLLGRDTHDLVIRATLGTQETFQRSSSI